MTLSVRVQRLPHARDLPLPDYATAQAAGLDLLAAAAVEIAPMGRALVPTGVALELSEGFEGQ
ncbi:MAG TPA: dUTP diphosphatase, partial [Beijerinckiaceae bacterium]|nr:dUTP diphosphatase [Beijerinckiaceae bacterium]